MLPFLSRLEGLGFRVQGVGGIGYLPNNGEQNGKWKGTWKTEWKIELNLQLHVDV